MNHLRTLQASVSPTLRAIMADEQPPAARARMMAMQLNGKLEAGNLRRLPVCELVELRALVFALDALADQIEAAAPVPTRRRAWWRRWFQ